MMSIGIGYPWNATTYYTFARANDMTLLSSIPSKQFALSAAASASGRHALQSATTI
jgi:hypothetical protein